MLDVLVFGKHNPISEIQNELPQRKASGASAALDVSGLE